MISPTQGPLTYNTQTENSHPCPPAVFEPAIPSSERPQTHALDHVSIGFEIGLLRNILLVKIFSVFVICYAEVGPPMWSSGQSFWLQIQRSRVRFPALPDFQSGSGSGTGSTQPREFN